MGMRAMAPNETNHCENEEEANSAEPKVRTIRGQGMLRRQGCPKPLSPDCCILLKKITEMETCQLQTAILEMREILQHKNSFAAVVTNVIMTAVDYDITKGMPAYRLIEFDVLWDVGAPCTFVTRDILGEEFTEHLDAAVHDPYRDPRGVRIQVSFAIDFTNVTFGLNTIAWVVDKEELPNAPTGIIIGQDSVKRMEYISIPRSAILAKEQPIDDCHWGDVFLCGFLSLRGVHKKIEPVRPN